jgi:pyruvate-formate lyase-activating enzyme
LSAGTEAVEAYKQELYAIRDWVPECNFCKEREEKGMHSPRLDANKTQAIEWVDGEGVNLEFQIDKDCNGACLICGSWNSTTWEQYTTQTINKKVFTIKGNEDNVETWLRQIHETVKFDKVRHITFLGGEPLRTDTHFRILQEVKKVQDLSKVRVTYITNGSAKPTTEQLELWSELAHLNLHFSLDAIGEHFNYLRWPLQWSQVEKNLRYIIDLNLPNLSITGSYTLTPFNIFYHDRYDDWASEFFKDTPYNPKNIFRQPFMANGVMSLAALPPVLAMVVRKKYINTTSSGNDHSVDKCIPGYTKKAYDEFMEHIEYHDKHRKLAWREVFPEIEKYFI